MSFEITGKLIEKGDVQQVSDRFRKREFVLEKVERNGTMEFQEFIKFQITQDKCDLIDPVKVGDELKVNFNIRGRKWEKNGQVSYFTNLEAWRVEPIGTASGPSSAEEAPFDSDGMASFSNDDDDDVLPF